MGPKFWSRRLESNFLRDFNDWELDMVGDLIHVLRGHRPSLEEDSVFGREEEIDSSRSKKRIAY